MTDKLFQTFIHYLVAKAAIKLPFLALPVINPVFIWIFTKIATFFYDQLSVMVNYKIIDINIYRELVGYGELVDALKNEKDKTKIPELRARYDEKLKHLISFNSNFVRQQSSDKR